ncbi:thiol reductase thioredoxin [Virgibacillus profundi]|uniref:Thiol reductase thioredoxin n=1 Tax=Virgibacillus profundi TaxID=2024555 RepID=A0A2A2IFI0_9BACI|nr:thioredoxin family protein [Virgibacillus profundi]PAV30118.1 thiol reductase thioredoxin [Virgibacillus profundi]PXY54290.1 thioredoxin [Virgibacillus profundi]
MKTLETIEQYNEMTNKENVIMMFTAGWCPDCRVIEPVLPEIEAEFPEYTFVEVNRDDFIEICQEQDVYGIPSFLAYKNGKEAGRFVSKDRKTKEEIIKFIKGLPA